jgi:hypothetical protein
MFSRATAVEWGILGLYAIVTFAAMRVVLDSVPSAAAAFLWPLFATATALGLRVAVRSARRVARTLVTPAVLPPYAALTRLTRELSSSGSLDDAMPRLARMLVDGTAAQRAEVWLMVSGTLVLAASEPPSRRARSVASIEKLSQLDGVDHVTPVHRGGDLLGVLTLGTAERSFLTAIDVRLMTDAANTAGIVFQNARLLAELKAQVTRTAAQAEELRAARHRLVTAQDDARRQLVHEIRATTVAALDDLADDAARIRDGLDQDRERTLRQLDRAQSTADQLIAEFRAIVHGVSPESLGELPAQPATPQLAEHAAAAR